MDSNTTIRDLQLGEAFSHPLRAFWNPVTALELDSSPDGTQLAVICDDGSVRVAVNSVGLLGRAAGLDHSLSMSLWLPDVLRGRPMACGWLLAMRTVRFASGILPFKTSNFAGGGIPIM
jgi:hypothetical protein